MDIKQINSPTNFKFPEHFKALHSYQLSDKNPNKILYSSEQPYHLSQVEHAFKYLGNKIISEDQFKTGNKIENSSPNSLNKNKTVNLEAA
jgi:hypothetical protein